MSPTNKPEKKGQTVKKFYTVEELADELSVCRETIRRRIRTGEILTKPIGRYHRIPIEEVKKFTSLHRDK
jgi:excisionase family DNA binding protein